jgi:hypothetical protein
MDKPFMIPKQLVWEAYRRNAMYFSVNGLFRADAALSDEADGVFYGE